MRFKPGESGNPNGRPKGSRNRTTVALQELLDGEAVSITRKAIEQALSGDMAAIRLCLDRVLPARKDRAVEFALPPIETAADAVKACAAIAADVAGGELTPSEGAELSKLVDGCTRAIEAGDFEARLARLERTKTK